MGDLEGRARHVCVDRALPPGLLGSVLGCQGQGGGGRQCKSMSWCRIRTGCRSAMGSRHLQNCEDRWRGPLAAWTRHVEGQEETQKEVSDLAGGKAEHLHAGADRSL